jgi:ribosomal RNA methyltransferase Nop2
MTNQQEASEYSSDAESEEAEGAELAADDGSKAGGISKADLDDWLGSSGSEDEDDLLLRRQAKLQQDQDEFFQDEAEEGGSGANLVDLTAPAVDYDSVRDRVSAIILTLQDLKRLGDPSLSRQDYVSRLQEDLCLLFQYNRWLVEKLCSLVKTGEILDFIEANERPRPVVIRTNTLRTRRKELKRVLNNRGVRLGDVGSWTKLGLIVFESQVPLGSTPEYLAGHYMLQSPSSFLPVMALNPERNMRILDMCAAPGGKTTHIAQLMSNTGILVANDRNRSRTASLIANIHRLGVVNTIVVNYDGRAFPGVMGGFNQVLLDAPCSGTGVIARDPSVKTSKSEKEVEFLTKNQKELILHAYDSVKASGGRLCYCTCSVLVEENEEVVDYLLKHRPASRVILPQLDKEFDESLVKGIIHYCGKDFDRSIENSRRVYPHRFNMDGFYLAIIEVLAHAVDASQRPVELEQSKPDLRCGKVRKFSKRFGGK